MKGAAKEYDAPRPFSPKPLERNLSMCVASKVLPLSYRLAVFWKIYCVFVCTKGDVFSSKVFKACRLCTLIYFIAHSL